MTIDLDLDFKPVKPVQKDYIPVIKPHQNHLPDIPLHELATPSYPLKTDEYNAMIVKNMLLKTRLLIQDINYFELEYHIDDPYIEPLGREFEVILEEFAKLRGIQDQLTKDLNKLT